MKTTLSVIVVALLVLFGYSVIVKGVHINTGSGQHTGYVTAVEQEGLIFKTYRVYVKTDPQSSQEDSYCLPPFSNFLTTTLDDVSSKRTLVTIRYASWLIPGLKNCAGEGSYITQVSSGN